MKKTTKIKTVKKALYKKGDIVEVDNGYCKIKGKVQWYDKNNKFISVRNEETDGYVVSKIKDLKIKKVKE